MQATRQGDITKFDDAEVIDVEESEEECTEIAQSCFEFRHFLH